VRPIRVYPPPGRAGPGAPAGGVATQLASDHSCRGYPPPQLRHAPAVVQGLLGHASERVPARYPRVHHATVCEAFGRFHQNRVNILGEVLGSDPDAPTAEGERRSRPARSQAVRADTACGSSSRRPGIAGTPPRASPTGPPSAWTSRARPSRSPGSPRPRSRSPWLHRQTSGPGSVASGWPRPYRLSLRSTEGPRTPATSHRGPARGHQAPARGVSTASRPVARRLGEQCVSRPRSGD
jgi:hypothetical protein